MSLNDHFTLKNVLISGYKNCGGVWYMYLKTENMCLKICVEIRVDEKVCENTCNIVKKLKTYV